MRAMRRSSPLWRIPFRLISLGVHASLESGSACFGVLRRGAPHDAKWDTPRRACGSLVVDPTRIADLKKWNERESPRDSPNLAATLLKIRRRSAFFFAPRDESFEFFADGVVHRWRLEFIENLLPQFVGTLRRSDTAAFLPGLEVVPIT